MDIIVRGWKKDLLQILEGLLPFADRTPLADPRLQCELLDVHIGEEDPGGVRNSHDDWEATLTITTSTPGLSGFVLPVVEAALGVTDD